MVETLLAAGADPAAATRYGAVPLALAAGAGHTATVRALLAGGAAVEPGPDLTPAALHPVGAAALEGQSGVLQLLLRAGARPDRAARHTGWTPLHLAAAAGSVAALELLLEAGAEAGRVTRCGAAPLDLAAGAGRTEAAALLGRVTGRPVPGPGGHEVTLHGAARVGDIAQLEHLLAEGDGEVDAQDQDGATPLILAAIGEAATLHFN